ncbi:hypothetical protein [Liberiplasma polymorphum]|jgi:hypothetical protein|uniref:hypothetical protein n=1 Tax=Liberiplasma polymorphum TaxID=3374570 RepID=UPI003775B3AD
MKRIVLRWSGLISLVLFGGTTLFFINNVQLVHGEELIVIGLMLTAISIIFIIISFIIPNDKII